MQMDKFQKVTQSYKVQIYPYKFKSNSYTNYTYFEDIKKFTIYKQPVQL